MIGTAPPGGGRVTWGQRAGWVAAFGAAVVLVAISCAMNYKFGTTMGRTPEDGHIYGLAAVAADVLKALSPFVIVAAFRRKLWANFTAGIAVFLVVGAFALVGALGHLSLNRNDVTGKREVASTDYKELRSDEKRLNQNLAWIPQHRGVATIEADMRTAELQRMWTLTARCGNVQNAAGRQFCGDYNKLVAELGSAREAASIDAKLKEVKTKLAKFESGVVEADPQASSLSKLTGFEMGSVQIALLLLFVALLEVGSGLAPFAAAALIKSDIKAAKSATDEKTATEAATKTAPATTEQARKKDDDADNEPPADGENKSTVVHFPKPATAAKAETSTSAAMVAVPSIAAISATLSLPVKREAALPDLLGLIARIGTIPAEKHLAKRWGVHKATVNKWVRSAQWKAHIQRQKVGRSVRITGASHPLAA